MTAILLVGCGKMGRAMLDGWFERGIAASAITVVEPSDAARAALAGDVAVVADADALAIDYRPAIVIFAVKPQGMAEIVPGYRRFADAVFLSIAAGKPLAFFAGHLGGAAAIVRAMPNTPAAVRRGITVACASAAVTTAQRTLCHDLLDAVGAVEWIGDEGLMDAVTAVSGSGPAYVFLLVEALAAAGVEAGLPEGLAVRLARTTVYGAGELVRQSPDTAAVLRRNVTSPGGTTAAALEVLMGDDGLPSLMQRAVLAAARRSRELAG